LCGIHARADGTGRGRVEGGKRIAPAATPPPLDRAAGALQWRIPKVVARGNLTMVQGAKLTTHNRSLEAASASPNHGHSGAYIRNPQPAIRSLKRKGRFRRNRRAAWNRLNWNKAVVRGRTLKVSIRKKWTIYLQSTSCCGAFKLDHQRSGA
jgi:hypothetical protein